MTTREFIANIGAFRAANARPAAAMLFWLSGGLALPWAGMARLQVNAAWVVPFLSIWLIGVVVSVTLCTRAWRGNAKRLGLLCPHCHTDLLRIKAIVVATRHCGRCGEQVLDESVTASEGELDSLPEGQDNAMQPWQLAMIGIALIVGVAMGIRTLLQ